MTANEGLSLFDSSVLITACDCASSFEEKLLVSYGSGAVAYTSHLFAELRITSRSGSEGARRSRLARLDQLCGVFLMDSDPRGSFAKKATPSEVYDRYRPTLPLDVEYRSENTGDFGRDLRNLGDLVLSEVNMTPIQLNNTSPDKVFSQLGAAYQKVGADIWSIFDRVIDDMAKSLMEEPEVMQKRRLLTPDGLASIEKRMAVMKWMMILNLLGYHRDAKDVSWTGAFFDCLHAASAIFCDRFVTSDRRQANRAAAAFWREGIPVEVLLIRPNDRQVVAIK